jgi:hypothetical protein
MRKPAILIGLLLLVVVAAPRSSAQLADPCRAWTCLYEFSGVEGEQPRVSCYEVGGSKGQWVSCTVERQCMWVITESGKQRQCTAGECQGEYCMWV